MSLWSFPQMLLPHLLRDRRAFIGSSLMEVENMLENSLKTRSKNGIDRLSLALPPTDTKQNREVLMP